MKKMLICYLFILFVGLSFVNAETYDISESELEQGYTKDLSSVDRINFPIEGGKGYISVASIFINAVELYIFANDRVQFTGKEHPDHSEIFSHEKKFEMTQDNYYDVLVTLENATIGENDLRIARITVKKLHEEISEETKINYECWEWYTCWDDSKILYCDYLESGRCGCRAVSPSIDCPQRETCEEKYYTCPDGTKIKECELVVSSDGHGGGCGCLENPEELCPEEEIEEANSLNNTLESSCPEIISPTQNFCKLGEIQAQYDDKNCTKEYKCMKKLSNGQDAEIKIMPSTASQTAIDKLGELEFEVELKEVGKICFDEQGCKIREDETMLIYELIGNKQGRFLGLFKINGELITQIDASTGKIISVKKPWWSFLSTGI